MTNQSKERLSALEVDLIEDGREPSHLVGWVLWNIVRGRHAARGASWPAGIFEDLPLNEQVAWNLAAGQINKRLGVTG